MSERFNHITGINAARWDAAVEGRPFSSHAWMAYGERVHAGDRVFYQLVRNRGRDESAAVAWVRNQEQLPIANPVLRRLVGGYLRARPLVTCQAPISPHAGLYAGAGASGLGRLARGLKAILNEVAGSFLIVPYLEPEVAASPAWGAGFVTATLAPNMYLPLRWHSFEDYVGSLRRSVRKDFRRARNQARRRDLHTEILVEPPPADQVLPLVRSVERRFGAAPAPWAESLLQARLLPGCRWILVRRKETLVGCGLMLRDRRFVSLTQLGLAGRAPYVYYLLMYGAIRAAIESGALGIFGGGGAYEFKARLGFRRTSDTRVLFYARSPRLRRFGAWLAGREAPAPPALLAPLVSIRKF